MITEHLFEIADEKYADFSAKLTPGIERSRFIGVRVPKLRALAKELIKADDTGFIKELPHNYYDENILHSLMISLVKDFDKAVALTEEFLPYIDNWAVCDLLSPNCFAKNKDRLLVKIREWISSEHVYTVRFAIGMLMSHFLDKDFKKEYLEIPAAIRSDEYYINMMLAWFYATALAKQWDESIVYIEEKRLSLWVHNKTIQKAVESRRISEEEKNYLRSLRIR